MATTHNPKIHAYSIIRPHSPFPSVILRNIPILFPAASIVVLVRSIPDTARSKADFSPSSVAWKLCEEDFNCEASVRSELVRSSCSILWVLSSASVPESLFVLLPVAAAFSVDDGGAGWAVWRFRRVGSAGGLVDDGVGVGVVVVAVADVMVCCASLVPFTSRCESDGCVGVCWSFGRDTGEVAFSATGLENSSVHSSSMSSVSSSSSSFASALAFCSSRMVCIRFRSCLSRVISDCASCLRSRGLICGRERSSWVRSERAYSTFCGLG